MINNITLRIYIIIYVTYFIFGKQNPQACKNIVIWNDLCNLYVIVLFVCHNDISLDNIITLLLVGKQSDHIKWIFVE